MTQIDPANNPPQDPNTTPPTNPPTQPPPFLPPPPPRMINWLLVTAVLMVLALWWQQVAPGTLLAVSLYKAHLMALGGWGGYWLDRALFPYDRPHIHLQADPAQEGDDAAWNQAVQDGQALRICSDTALNTAMLRRAIIVAACLVCVGLGA